MPIWIAYIAAPLLLLAFMSGVIWRSESPMFLTLFAIGSGLVCAACLHGYLVVKKRLSMRGEMTQTP